MSAEESRRAPAILVERRRWRLALRIARGTMLREKARYATAVAIIVVPVVLLLIAVSAWVISASPRFVLSQILGPSQATQAIAYRISETPLVQDPLGTVESLGEGALLEEEAQTLLDTTVPQGDRIEVVETIRSVRLTRVGAAKSTSVEDALQAGALDAPGLDLEDASGELAAGHAVLSTDLARELGVGTGEELVVSTSANAGQSDSSQKAEILIDAIIAGERRLVIGEGTLDLATYAVGSGSTSAFAIIGEEPITWDDVQTLNEGGYLVVSRAVLADPSLSGTVGAVAREAVAARAWQAFVISLTALLVLSEIVLLLALIYAVAQNRTTRSAAMLFAIGGDHNDQGRLITAIARTVGLLASAITLIAIVIANRVYEARTGLGIAIIPWPAYLAAAVLPYTVSLIAAIVPARDLAAIDSVAVLRGIARTPSRLVRRAPIYPLALLFAFPALLGALGADSLLLLAIGVVLLLAGLIGSIPYLIAAQRGRRDPASISARLALRDAVRNGGRTLPALAALISAAFISSSMLIILASANEAAWNADAHVGPRGSVFLSDADSSDSTVQARAKQEAAAAKVEALRSVAASQTLYGMPWASTQAGPALIVEALSEDGSEALSLVEGGRSLREFDLAYIVDDGSFLVASGLVSDDEMVRAVTTLSSGGVLIPDEDFLVDGRQAHLRAVDMTSVLEAEAAGRQSPADPTILAEARAPATSWTGLNLIVLSPEAARSLTLPSTPIGRLLILDRPIPQFQAGSFEARIMSEEPGTTATVVVPENASLLLSRLAALISLVAAAATVALVVVLASADLKRDFETLEAIGASSRIRRSVSAYQGIGLALLAVPVAILSGLLVGVISVVVIASSGAFPGLEGLALVIPYGEIGLLLVGTPILAATVALSVSRRVAFGREQRG